MKTKDTISEVIGFDFGHAETAVTKAKIGAPGGTTEVLEVDGKAPMVTAVSETERGVLVGSNAYRRVFPEGLRVAFKSPRLKDPEVRRPTALFVQQVIEILTKSHQIKGGAESLFVAGCPSGWSWSVRRDYEALLREVGMQQVRVVAESHAAFLAAREVKDLSVSSDDLQGSVLIVDIGSSTTDFTAVVGREEKRIDFGSNELGAGLLDKMILERSLNAELRELFEEFPTYRDVCLLHSRQAKEEYFNSSNTEEIPVEVSKSIRISTNKRILFRVEIWSGDMDKILSTSIGEYLRQPDEECGGLDWPSAFLRELQQAREKMGNSPPQIVLLTGGASRMDFVLKCCERVFPQPTKVVKGAEPQFTIARGLALAGRTNERLERFRSEIEDILAPGELQKMLREESEKDEGSPLDHLIAGIAGFVSYELLDVTFQAFVEWREGHISTLNGLEKEIEKRSRSFLEGLSGAGSQVLESEVVKPWLDEFVKPAVERLIDPICKKARIPGSALNISPDFVPPSVDVGDPDINPLENIDTLGAVTAVVGSIIIATLLGGGGTAILVSGPIGWMIGLVIGVCAAFLGKEVAMDILKDSDILVMIRKVMISEETVQERLEENQEELWGQTYDALQEKAHAFDDLLESIARGTEAELMEKAKEAEMLIK